MIILTHTITARLQYIADFVGRAIVGQPFQLTSEKEEFIRAEGVKINYTSERHTSDECWIKPHPLLSETGICQQRIDVFKRNGQISFFKTEGDLGFDIFAASFYLLSRYEEYLPYQLDEYGRYAHSNSLAFKEGFLNRPLVNIWLEEFFLWLQKKYPFISSPAQFKFLPTYDIDEAFSFKHKGLIRSAGGIGKAVAQGQFSEISRRIKVLKGDKGDPFDAYDWMDELHQQFRLKPHYFFLVPASTGKYDRNILPVEKGLQELIKRHAEEYKIGIHPSWQSGDQPSLLQEEKETLENISGKKITMSRQHFIRFKLPQSFRRLIDVGIKEDFSMGYGSINGFRASVTTPFYWYDLEKEESTNLLLYPFCFMEANSFFEQKLTPAQALEELQHYYKEVNAVSGTLITIWHNTFLGSDNRFKGWKEIYGQFLESFLLSHGQHEA